MHNRSGEKLTIEKTGPDLRLWGHAEWLEL